MILWIGLYRQLPAPLLIFPLFTKTLGLGVSGIWWGLAVVNWSAAIAITIIALKKMKLRTTAKSDTVLATSSTTRG